MLTKEQNIAEAERMLDLSQKYCHGDQEISAIYAVRATAFARLAEVSAMASLEETLWNLSNQWFNRQ